MYNVYLSSLYCHSLLLCVYSYDGKTISLRYDWRACLAVVRAFLPVHEKCVGLTFQGIDHEFYGIFSDESYADKDEWPLDECFAAGSGIDQCRILPEESSSSQSIPFFTLSALILSLYWFISVVE